MFMLGLCLFVFAMLLRGQGLAVAAVFWALSMLYVFGLGAPSVAFASSLFMLGLLAMVGQLVLNLQE
jgi:hypothetical protein